MTAAWIEQARSLTQSSSIPLGVPIATHMDMLLRDTRRDLRVACDALDAVLEITEEHYSWQLRRAAKFGRTASDCVCAACRVRSALAALGIETGASDD